MADPKGFLKHGREVATRRPVEERVQDWNEVYPGGVGRALLPIITEQAGRCMDCGIPFCHQGCPLGNIIPEWNDLVWRDDWDGAMDRLHATNNFPEFTGRLCPAPCETACVLGINQDPVTIKNVEVSIIDRAWDSGYVRPEPPEWLSGRTVAVIGSGPAGLAAAQQLTRAGHTVAVYERADKIGGLLRYGIPEFKMEKKHLDRRIDQMRREGTVFRAGVDVGGTLTADQLRDRYDAVVLAMGATEARDLPVPGRELGGIHQAMEFLPQANRVALGEAATQDGSDQITRHRQARRHHRRRRHRRRLPRHVHPPGRREHHAAGDHAGAAVDAARRPAVADVPDDLPGLLGARGGRRPGVRRVDPGVPRRRGRQRPGAAPGRRGLRGRQAHRDRGHRARDPGRAGAARDGLHRSREGRADRPARVSTSTSAATWRATSRTCPRCRASSWPATPAAASR